jgi:hypothetical protein
MSNSCITETESVRNGARILRENGLFDEIHAMIKEMATTAGTDTAVKRVMDEYDWTTDKVIAVGGNRPRLDGFKARVGIEHEKKEQMNVRSHLLFGEAIYQQNEIDIWVGIIPTGSDATVGRTAREFNYAIFTEYFPLEVPAYLIGYELV